jgi:hypothetical protein
MFRSSTIIRELVLTLAKVIFMLKHSIKLRRYMKCGGVAAGLWAACSPKTASTYVPPMPCDLPQLRRRIVEAVAAINRQMLQRVWQELDYRIDICRVTKGGHIEHM